jgi:hypothetical protein
MIKQTPSLPDHGVPEHNVLHRVSGGDFAIFFNQASNAAQIARRAFDATTVSESAEAWRELFGDAFPEPPSGEGNKTAGGGFTKRTAVTTIGGGRWG